MTAYEPDNIFAKILRGEIPSNKVYDDEWAYAFEDINAQAQVHVLVIPKGRYVSWDDFSAKAEPDEIAGFVRAVGKVARDLAFTRVHGRHDLRDHHLADPEIQDAEGDEQPEDLRSVGGGDLRNLRHRNPLARPRTIRRTPSAPGERI